MTTAEKRSLKLAWLRAKDVYNRQPTQVNAERVNDLARQLGYEGDMVGRGAKHGPAFQ